MNFGETCLIMLQLQSVPCYVLMHKIPTIEKLGWLLEKIKSAGVSTD